MAVTMAVTGCGGGSSSAAYDQSKEFNPAQSGTPGPSSSGAESSRKLAPGFTVTPIGARPYTLSEHRGNVVVVYFMAAWCVTCIPEAQALARIHEEYEPRGVDVIILDVDPTENERDLLRFKEQYSDADHYWAMDTNNRVIRAYGVRFLDSTVIIDRQGMLAYSDSVSTSHGKLRREIEKLL